VNSQAGLAATLRVMLHCDALDSVVFFATGAVVDAVAPLLLAEQQATKRLLCVMVTGASEAAQVLERVGIPVFRDISRGAMALAKIGLWNHRRHTKTVPTERIGVSRDTRIVTAIIDRMRAAGRNSLDEYAAKALVSAYGIRTPKEFVVKSPAEALAAVDEIGGPVVMKMLSDAVTHKTELGGVRIGVARPDVARVFGELAELAGDGDQTPGVLVQQQEAAGFELLISSSHDPALGTFITVAAGGVTTELLDDAVYALLPLSENAASDMLKGLRCYPLLTGYRGRPGFGFVAVRDALLAFSDLSTDFGNTIAEVEVNPLIVTAAGVVAVDAVVTLTAARNFRES
jgi:acyl-CoA synthetase (NDP forming)